MLKKCITQFLTFLEGSLNLRDADDVSGTWVGMVTVCGGSGGRVWAKGQTPTPRGFVSLLSTKCPDIGCVRAEAPPQKGRGGALRWFSARWVLLYACLYLCLSSSDSCSSFKTQLTWPFLNCPRAPQKPPLPFGLPCARLGWALLHLRGRAVSGGPLRAGTVPRSAWVSCIHSVWYTVGVSPWGVLKSKSLVLWMWPYLEKRSLQM